MKALRLHEISKRIAEQMKLKSSDVRAVLESKKTDLPKAAVKQITELARTMIHEELMRIDAQRHPDAPPPQPRRGRAAAPRRSR
ncbi:MAG: hypothetical protein EPO02_10650 [Nitrospirae bacterium]|nr:MAG: hypothetical protein EPO02_10650 [Nitrospirota bacterium]